jgi:glycosyltransferase involved in cell wall biosynthesis
MAQIGVKGIGSKFSIKLKKKIQMGIPEIIHQTWKTADIPSEMVDFQRTWTEHHPDWEYRLWTDDDNRQLIEKHYAWFLPIYDSYAENICRVDAARYFILHHCGGLYVDLDFECLRSLHQLLEGRSLVIGLEPALHAELPMVKSRSLNHLLCPSLIASEVAHPFWASVFQDLAAYRHEPDPLDATGPFLLTRTYDAYPVKDPITLVSAEKLYPVTKFDCRDGLLEHPEFRQAIAQTALAIHHWHGTWVNTATTNIQRPESLSLAMMQQGRIVTHSTLRYNLYQSLAVQESDRPLISCMMVTKNRLEQAKLAIQCFQHQTYPHTELIIVDDDRRDLLANYVKQLANPSIRHLRLAPEHKTLGELRNLALVNTSGTYVCQWDDDDLAHPLRLELQMAALQTQAADACFLQRWLMWWVDLRRIAISRTRVWEGSMLCRKDLLFHPNDANRPIYPDQRSGEDTSVVSQILQHGRVILLDQPHLYVYVIHQQNTFNETHFEQHWQQASTRYEGIHYEEMLEHLAQTMPLIEYQKLVGSSRISIAPSAAPSVISASTRATLPSPQSVSGRDLDPTNLPTILILTPVKNAVAFLPQYLENLRQITYPHAKISLGFLDSDSTDGTYDWLQQQQPALNQEFRNVHLFRQDFQFDRGDLPRWDNRIQFHRRSVLAKSRNILLHRSLQDEDWVLWLDVDVTDYPPDIIGQLLQTGKTIVVPNCVTATGGNTFDLNTFKFQPGAEDQDWTDYVVDGIVLPPKGMGRWYLEDLRDRSIVAVDGVGGTMLLIKADIHREGLIFPPFSYKLYIETEGLAMMAKDMGYTCWGLPQLEIIHAVSAEISR